MLNSKKYSPDNISGLRRKEGMEKGRIGREGREKGKVRIGFGPAHLRKSPIHDWSSVSSQQTTLTCCVT